MSREWLALVEKGKRKLKFSPSSPFPSSFILSPWQPPTIEHRSLYSCSFIRFCSFVASRPSIAAAAVAPVSFAFLLAKHQHNQPSSLLLPIFTNNNASTPERRRYPGGLVPVNAGTVPGHNSGPLHFYPSPERANIWAGLAEGPSRPAEGSGRFGKGTSGKGCYTSEVPAWAGVPPEGIGSSGHCLRDVRS